MPLKQLSAQDVVRAWEWGWNRHLIDRALFMLQLAAPDLTWDELAALSVGRRNAWLLSVREQLFGPVLACYVNCPRCTAALEFALDTANIRAAAESEQAAADYQLALDGWAVHFRLPDSRDLAALVDLAGHADARQLLLRRCVTQVSCDTVVQAPDALPEHVVTALADRLQDLDPQAEVRLRLTCEQCGYDWPATLDI